MMSTIFWNALKLSPALLGASLLVASSTYARESVTDQTAAATTDQAAAIAQPSVEPLASLPQTTVAPSSIEADQSAPEKTTATTGQAAAIAQPSVESLASLPQTTVKETSDFQVAPTQVNPSQNQANSILAQQVPATDNAGSGTNDVLEQIQLYNGENSDESTDSSLDQVTNVTQLRDVSPGDWAFEALRSLVERYGCIAGYPDGTYRGNRAMSRYEFAAGLNACLQQVERLIASSTADFVTRGDLETLQRLVQEFQTELTTLGTRVDALDGRVAFLEDHQFSTTTKLNAEIVVAVSDLFGDQDANGNEYSNGETVLHDRVRLNFDTSFTGKDRLRVRLQAGNVTEFGPLTGPSSPGTNITREGRFGFAFDNGNDIILEKLYYRFPLAKAATVFLIANGGGSDDYLAANTLNPLDSSGSGSISRFGLRNPIYRIGGQNAGASLILGPANSPFNLSLGYLANGANDPSEKAGLFDGSYSALAQLTFKPSKAIAIAATYINSYDRDNLRHGTGSIASQIDTNSPVLANSYGIEASFAFSPQIILSGWVGYTNATVIGTGNADVWNYAATLAINDIGSKGSTLGFVVGMEPKLTDSDSTVAALLPGGRSEDPDTGLHVEGFYKFKLTNNIAITPGVIWLTAPGHNEDNDDIFIGTLRTTFTF